MKNSFPHLLSPIQIGTQVYKNRVISAPRGGVWNFEPNCDDTDPEQLADAEVKCEGGVAAYCVGETAVCPSGGREANEFYGFSDYSEPHMRRYCQYAQCIHTHGAKALIELSHMGAEKPESTPGAPALGPMDWVNSAGVQVKGMTEADIAQTCQAFADAARFMQKAGFDGVILHSGHGWLPHQFFSTRWNQRSDRFGGSIANRARFTVLVLDSIRAACGPDFILECRISGQENVEDGYSMEEIIGYCRELEGHCDLIHVSAGLYNRPMETKMVSTLYDAHGCNVEVAAKIKARISTPVSVVGGIHDPADAEVWIAQGKCDLVVLCRQLQANPDWVRKAAQGREAQIRKCIRCMRCYPGPFEEAMEELHGEFPEGCTVNPYLLHFDLVNVPKAERIKKLLIVGGGVAGMQAAITARRRGHAVTLLEKSNQLGGILNFAKDDADKYDLKALADSMAEEVSASGAEVRLNTEVTAALMRGYDQVILAIGSSPLLPPIPGLSQALPALKAYRPDAPIGQRVIILGGGLVGCETAIHLARQGRQVTIVEMRGELAPDAYRLHKHKLRQIIQTDKRISVLLEAKCLAVLPDGAKIFRKGQQEQLSADTVIAALGMRANDTTVLEQLARQIGVPYTKIGDCVRARKIYDAIEEGFLAGMRV